MEDILKDIKFAENNQFHITKLKEFQSVKEVMLNMMKWRLLVLINYQKECRKFYYQYYDRSPCESWPSLPYLFNTTHISVNYQLNKEPIVVNFLGVIHRNMENNAKNIVSRIALGIFVASQICTLLSSIGIAYFYLSSGNKEGYS